MPSAALWYAAVVDIATARDGVVGGEQCTVDFDSDGALGADSSVLCDGC